MKDTQTTIAELKENVMDFARQRGWEESYTALNLAVSINLEASELLEIFQWCDWAEADKAARETDREHFLEELADVMLYCIEMASTYDVDIASAIEDKMRKNAVKYPAKQPQA